MHVRRDNIRFGEFGFIDLITQCRGKRTGLRRKSKNRCEYNDGYGETIVGADGPLTETRTLWTRREEGYSAPEEVLKKKKK